MPAIPHTHVIVLDAGKCLLVNRMLSGHSDGRCQVDMPKSPGNEQDDESTTSAGTLSMRWGKITCLNSRVLVYREFLLVALSSVEEDIASHCHKNGGASL